MFFWNSCFFHDPTDVGNLISGPSVFSKTSLNIWKFTVHLSLKLGLENFEHYLTSVWDECNCAVVWAFFGIAFLRDWNENWPFPVLWPLLSFPNLQRGWSAPAATDGTEAWQRRYPLPGIRGSREELPYAWGQGRRGEEQPQVKGAVDARVQESREKLLHVQGQEGQLWGDIPRPR